MKRALTAAARSWRDAVSVNAVLKAAPLPYDGLLDEGVGWSKSYLRNRTYNCVRDSPKRLAALDLFHPVSRITCSMVWRSTVPKSVVLAGIARSA